MTIARLATVLALAAATCPLRATAGGTPGDPYAGYSSPIYADTAHWLCRPDTTDVCDDQMDATVVKANGRTSVQRFRPAKNPPIDCFYVYPTISEDPTGNSDLVPSDDAELFVVRQQAARLGTVCRVFAPVYRQITLTALLARLGGITIPNDPNLGYGDVLDAFKHYVSQDSDGRGFLLIGHSQGAGVLRRLVQEEIDPNPALRRRLVSAMIIGSTLQVPDGADVGGDFANVPLCRSPRQTGCAISYASFRATVPPPSTTFFGRASTPGMKAACTNPASLRGGTGTLRPYFPTTGASLPIINVPPPVWVDPAKQVTITTPFVTLPRFVDATCVEQADGTVYLSLDVHGEPADPRLDDIGGDLTPDWGMHLVDVNVAMGDLVAIAKSQGKAYRKRR